MKKKQYDLRKKINDDRVKFYLGDIRHYSSVLEVTKEVDYIFHAAALKTGTIVNSFQWKLLTPT